MKQVITSGNVLSKFVMPTTGRNYGTFQFKNVKFVNISLKRLLFSIRSEFAKPGGRNKQNI